MAEERVVLTAELRDQMSAPLRNAQRSVDGFTDTVERGSRRQAAAVGRATSDIDSTLTRQNRLFSGMGGAIGRATDGAERMFRGMRTSINRSLDGIADHATRQGERAGSGFADGLKRLIGPALAFLGAQQLFTFANGAVESFSLLEDSSAAAGVVFGDSMQKILDQAATADAKLGLSQQAVITGSNTFGTYGKAAGLAGDDLAGFATGLTGLAADMASFKGTSTEQALEAIAAGLRGEAEPLRAFGVMLDDVQMRDEALRMGLIKTTKDALTPQQKVLAAQSLIFAQTTDAQGDFARTSQSTANIAKTLAAASENLSAKIGKVLAPTFTAVRVMALGAVGGLSKFFDGVLEAQQILAAGGTNADISTALGLTGPAKAIFDEGLGSIRAFFGAIKDGGDDVTSSGVAGFFEGLGVQLRNAWDRGKEFLQWLWDMKEPIGVIAGLILTLLIPRFVQLGIEALKSAVETRIAWAMTKGAAIQSAVVNAWAALAIVGGWVLMGATALIQGARIAAGWLLAMGPVGWIIGLIALVVGALVWFFTQTELGQQIVQNVWAAIQTAMSAVVDWWNSTLMPAIQAIGQFFTDAFNGVISWWNSTLMPAIAAVGQWFSDMFTQVGNFARDFVGFFVDGWGMLVDFFNGVLMPIIQRIGDQFAMVFDWIGRLIWNFMTIAVALWLKLVDLWNGVLMPAIQAVGQWFSDVFAGLWNNVLKPVVDSIVLGFQMLGDFFATVFAWIYNTIIKPYIDLIVAGFVGLVDFWNLTVIPGLQALGDFIGTIFAWIWNTLIKPVIDFIVAGFQGLIDLWNGVLMPGLQALGDFIGSIMTWIYETIIKPVIDGIVGAFNTLVDFWNNTLSPVMTSVGDWFSTTIGGAINGVKSFIDDNIAAWKLMIAFVQDKLQPVIDSIGAGFKALGDAIGVVLGKIGEFANNPLGGLQDMLGIKKDDNGQGIMPSNSGGGVYKGNGVMFAGGGVLGGYAPGRDVIPALLSPGESVLVPELTRAIGPANIMAANAEASGGRPAGSGPSLTSGYSGGSSRGGGTMTVHAPISITVEAGPNGDVNLDQLRAAVEEIFEEQRRRGY